ncbi:phage regulatory CII family protein [Paraburkholderia bannensis]|uniref:phage regulatory CII family protein n=1 Tax=Paraburkholderia bannensis TaxID=765414 RepID=UPI000483278E|nr:phage regulatory CII family protein [Paraburkholderia bannensis]
MNVTDTAHAVAHEYKGGCESLAPRMGLSGNILRNKVDPRKDSHKLSLDEAVRMTDLTDDDRILEAWARQRGYTLTKLPDIEGCNDAAIVELMAEAWSTHGLVGKEIVKTLEDGRVEHSEVERVEKCIFTHAQVLFNITARLRGMAE